MLYPNPELSLPSKDNPLFTNPERKAIIISLKKKERKCNKIGKAAYLNTGSRTCVYRVDL
jgi:hypothetical protein